MKPTHILAALLSLALAACDGEPEPPVEAASGDRGGPGVADGVDGARFDGVGPARFGMHADEVRAVWPVGLDGGPEAEGTTCYHLAPDGQAVLSDFALMFGDGRFVRYSVEGGDTRAAPGGGLVGMHEAEIESRYGADLARSAHKYVDDGEYLRIKDPDGGPGVLIFETDAGDTVTGWRVGIPPHVDYVEGCA